MRKPQKKPDIRKKYDWLYCALVPGLIENGVYACEGLYKGQGEKGKAI